MERGIDSISDFDIYFLVLIGISSCTGVPNFVKIATILNFRKSVILATPSYGNICVCTKFDEYTSIGEQQKAKNPNPRMANVTVLNFQGCHGYGYPWIYPWIYPCVDIRLRQYPWILMDTYGYFYVTALELATSQNHNKTKQNRLFVGQLVLVLNLS